MTLRIKKVCPSCHKFHNVTERDIELFGADIECMKCVDWKHVDFMRTTGARLKMTCVPGCRCGRGGAAAAS